MNGQRHWPGIGLLTWRARAAHVARWAAPVSWLHCVIAEGFIVLYDVESVLVTGPILLLLGLLMTAAGRMTHSWWCMGLGIAHVGVVILFILLVNLLQWSPHDAATPFAVMGAIYLLGTGPAVVLAWQQRPVIYEAWQCQACGYALFGLTAATCPECGRAFDSQQIEAATQSPAGAAAMALGDQRASADAISHQPRRAAGESER